MILPLDGEGCCIDDLGISLIRYSAAAKKLKLRTNSTAEEGECMKVQRKRYGDGTSWFPPAQRSARNGREHSWCRLVMLRRRGDGESRRGALQIEPHARNTLPDSRIGTRRFQIYEQTQFEGESGAKLDRTRSHMPKRQLEERIRRFLPCKVRMGFD